MMFRIIILTALFGVALSGSLVPRVSRAETVPENRSGEVQQNPADKIDTVNLDNSYIAPKQNYQFPLANHYYATYPEYSNSPQYNPSAINPNYQLSEVPQVPASNSWSSRIASGLVPLGSFALVYGGKVVIVILQFFMLVLIGLILTTSICTLTPFCTINFAGFGINNRQVRAQVEEVARSWVNEENINLLTHLVAAAMEKVNEQTQKEEAPTSRSPRAKSY